MKEFLTGLRTQAWRTAGARYNAARRLRRRELFSTVSLAFFSSLTIVLAFIQRIYAVQPGTQLDNYLTALSVCLGVFLLSISLMEWGAANGAKADSLHRNAEDLTAFQLKVAQCLAGISEGESMTWGTVETLRDEYETVKGRCSHNHLPLDDWAFRAERRKAPEFETASGTPAMTGLEAWWVLCRHWLASVWYFGLFWLAVGTVLSRTPWVQ